MYNNRKVVAVVLGAGSGNRFDSEINKVYIEINGKRVIEYSIEKFINNKYVDELILIVKEEEKNFWGEIIQKYSNIKIAYGGETRKDSVCNGLEISDANIAIIHDGARPLVTDEMISNCIEAMNEFKGVTVGIKSKDTIKITNDNDVITSTTERKNTWIIQTPQCFDKELLLKGHKIELEEGIEITDDCMIMEMLGYPVKVINGDYTNIKVTVKEDIELVKAFL